MGELRRYIKSNNLIMRVVSLVLAVTVLASALVYFGDENMPTVSAAEGTTKPYMEYIVQRLIDGAQEEFNVLEIVPYIGQGEFRYYPSFRHSSYNDQFSYIILQDNPVYPLSLPLLRCH